MHDSAATALYVLAFALLQNARPRQAAALLEALDATRPPDTRTLLALATAQVRQGQAGPALRTLDRIQRTASPCAPLHLLRAQALQALGRQPEAQAAIAEFLSLRAPAPSPEPDAH